VVEELVPLAVPVYGADSLPEGEAERLLAASPEPGQRPDQDVVEDMKALFERDDLPASIERAAEARRQALVLSRHERREKLQASGDAGELAWLEGADEIDAVSTDVLTVTMVYPR
jgi:hypothetical protein